MTESALRQENTPAAVLPARDERVAALLGSILRNRFLPEPNPDSVFVGDGDFRAVGVEFLGHFIRLAGLRPESRVLDIGCGIGRMAVPLTQYLDFEKGRYSGIDPVEGGIAWCRRFITPAYQNFSFQRVDIAHESLLLCSSKTACSFGCLTESAVGGRTGISEKSSNGFGSRQEWVSTRKRALLNALDSRPHQASTAIRRV